MNRSPLLPATGKVGIHVAEVMLTHRTHHPALSLVGGTACREVSDADLGRALLAGQAWAIDETWNRFAPRIHQMAKRALGVEAEAEDMVQEVFQRVFRKAATLREPEKLRNFIHAFAIHVLKSELRRRKARSWLTFQHPESMVDLSSGTLDMEPRYLLRRFYDLLDRLRPRDRLIYTLRNFEQMTIEEIVESTDLSISTVKRSLAHATGRLTAWSDADPAIAEFLDKKGHTQ